MKSMLRGRGLGIAGALLTLLAGSAAYAEGPAIGGYVDTQYIYNLDKPQNRTNALRSYDMLDNNINNTAHIALTGKVNDQTNYAVEFDAGNDATTTLGVANASTVGLQEAYLNWVSESKFGLKAGKFVTYQGIEVIESVANPTISRGTLFNLAEPLTHQGAVVTYTQEKWDAAVGLVNGWDVPNDNNRSKTWVAKFGLNLGDPLALTVSGLRGAEQSQTVGANNGSNAANMRSSVDVTALTKIIPSVDLFLQWNWGTEDNVADQDGDTILDDNDSWSGFGIQPVVHFGDKFSLAGRYEYFENGNGSRVTSTGAQDFSTYNITVTPGYKVNDNVIVRLEYRYDKAASSKLSGDGKIFQDDKGKAQDDSNTVSAQVAITF